MIPAIDPATLSGPAQKILGAPPKVLEMAAKGIAPGIRPGELVLVLAVLAVHETATVRDTAHKTLSNLPEPVIAGAIGQPLAVQAIHELATRYAGRIDVLERLLAMPELDVETVIAVAKVASETVAELLATNEERLLANPKIIEHLYLNKNTRMSTAERMVELAVRNNVVVEIPAWKEAAQAIQNELIMEPSDEPSPDDVFFSESLRDGTTLASDEDTHEQDEDGKERLKEKVKEKEKKIASMRVSEKVRAAMIGDREQLLLLVRDANRMVALAAAKSPQLTESDAEKLASNRSVASDVLGVIGAKPEFVKRYTVKKALAENPKTPVMLAMNLIKHLRESDLKLLEKNKNVSGPIRDAIKNHLSRRKS